MFDHCATVDEACDSFADLERACRNAGEVRFTSVIDACDSCFGSAQVCDASTSADTASASSGGDNMLLIIILVVLAVVVVGAVIAAVAIKKHKSAVPGAGSVLPESRAAGTIANPMYSQGLTTGGPINDSYLDVEGVEVGESEPMDMDSDGAMSGYDDVAPAGDSVVDEEVLSGFE
jgi:hypothetical protein